MILQQEFEDGGGERVGCVDLKTCAETPDR